jgi:hypothetical protein
MKPLATNIKQPDDGPIFIGLRKFRADSCTGLLDIDERGRRSLKFAPPVRPPDRSPLRSQCESPTNLFD